MGVKKLLLLMSILLPWAVHARQAGQPPDTLPAVATRALAASLEAARSHTKHQWRDTPPMNSDGTVNAYVEIARGDRRKWEFDMRANRLAMDRLLPVSVGGYPVNSPRRYGLAAKIGSQKWAYTGAEVTATQNGRLYLTCNDDSPSDNNGKFVVTVEIIRRR